ncbi:uncharacterized protein BDZ99DRAFT_511345 [Mytilinidion resinicola]|uniref:ABC transporter domain-containing protein n=1 Tax=Mytilinidion resinicola TaxID=574789 RepID=A0A6A6YBX8_9PEZI|nr:uncharacterized protein BDZ99DRAFT_511345 [Mytilinidion resinicola]KAF2805347.1 hypothetical protein BDZ99DRAFT_511345 [Mytilinidion resinicola]
MDTSSDTKGPLPLRQWLQRKQSCAQVQIGVAFRNLNVHGYLSAGQHQHQHTVASYLLAVPKYLLALAQHRAKTKVQILDDFLGLVQPGEILLVLGRPGSGCSTFLKAIAGDTHGIHVYDDTKINYQGLSYKQMHDSFKGECIYMAELDVHFPELTVGQTLAFAAMTREGDGFRKEGSQHISQNVVSLFSLGQSINTQVGNAMIRGVSGGEKKRTSIAEAFVSGGQIQCWDNSTRGLDSSTALQFIQLLRAATDALQSTVLMSIYQASELGLKLTLISIVTLLYEGRQIYFGLVTEAVEYFVNLGFIKPSRATTADFLTSLSNSAERFVREGYEDRVPRSAEEFATRWVHSPQARALREQIDVFNSVHPPTQTQLSDYYPQENAMQILKPHSSTYSISNYLQVVACISRGFLRLKMNYTPAVGALFGNTIIAIVTGSVFFNLADNTDSFQRRAVLLFFSIMINACTPAFEVLTMWAQRPIVEKHHQYAMYHPCIEGIANIFCDLPNKIATVVMFNIPIYFMANLRRTTSAWLTYLLFCFVTVVTMSMFFRMVGSLSKNNEQTMAPVAILILIFITYAGFVIPADYMVVWLGWLRWLNLVAYAYESLMINEFRERNFPCSSTIPAGPPYGGANDMQGATCAAVGANAGQSTVQGSSYIEVKYGYVTSHTWRNLGILLVMMVVFCTIHLLAAEYIPAQHSKGEILLFQKGHKGDRITGSDEEKTPITSFPLDQTWGEMLSIPAGHTHTPDHISTIQKQRAIFHWKNICYDIKTKEGSRRILTEVDGWVKPGTLTALMGATGAGKTTLLDVLACRTTVGVVTGDAFVDGKSRDASFQRKTGYVQQEDLHVASATVREALTFSALLRQPKTRTKTEKLDYVNTVLQMLNMEPYAHAVIGVAGEGLNVEQRKRLTIAIEIVARPELLLFLDEPTSGLDSQTAWSICMLLRKLAKNGQAILCTIHQPSSQLFQIFDRLLLLEKGGKTVYFGDIGTDASTLVNYFERNGAPRCGPKHNPAEWVLDVTSRKSRDKERALNYAWSDVWNNSPEKKDILCHIDELQAVQVDIGASPAAHDEYAAPIGQQLLLVQWRLAQEYWRTPTYLYSKLALCVGSAICTGFSFFTTTLDIQGLNNIIFAVFFLTNMFNTVDQQVIPRLTDNRDLFEARERRSKTYTWHVFVAANILIELFWQSFTAILVFVVWYFPIGLYKNGTPEFPAVERGGLVLCIIWMFCLFISTLSQAVGIAISHAETAVQIATLFSYLSMVFCGVIVAPKDLPGFWTFMYRVSPFTYFIDGVVIAGLADTSITCSNVETRNISLPVGFDGSCMEYLQPYLSMAGGVVENPNARADCQYCPISDTNSFLRGYGIEIEHPWRNFGFLSCYVVFNILATFGMYWVARVRARKGRQGM